MQNASTVDLSVVSILFSSLNKNPPKHDKNSLLDLDQEKDAASLIPECDIRKLDSDFDQENDAASLIPECDIQKLDSPPCPVNVLLVPLIENHPTLRAVFYLHDLFDEDFLCLLDDLAKCLPGSTESHNMFATRRFFESERIADAVMRRLPIGLGLRRVLPSMRFIE
jgi:hypothetical protein